MVELPPEIWGLIVGNAAKRDLARMCRVSKQFQAVLRPLLYREVKLKEENVETLELLSKDRRLASCVNSFVLKRLSSFSKRSMSAIWNMTSLKSFEMGSMFKDASDRRIRRKDLCRHHSLRRIHIQCGRVQPSLRYGLSRPTSQLRSLEGRGA